jgi:sucrose-6-phosphate hydrolase SacC (GH32 family)
MMLSTSLPQELSLAATSAIKAMLTPTEATSHATSAAVALTSTTALSARGITSSSRGRTSDTINSSSTASTRAGVQVGEDEEGSAKLSMEALMEAMGHAFTPSATTALMNLLVHGQYNVHDYNPCLIFPYHLS